MIQRKSLNIFVIITLKKYNNKLNGRLKSNIHTYIHHLLYDYLPSANAFGNKIVYKRDLGLL